jgi:hypothetical protein
LAGDATYLVSLGLGVRLEETVLDKVVSDLRVVPSAKDGRLGSGVVLIEEFLVLFLLELGGVVGAKSQYFSIVASSSNLHDTLADEPVPHLAFGPCRVGSVLGVKVVGLHRVEELVSGSGLGVGDTVLNEPLVKSRSGPGLVERAGGLEVGDSDIVQ